MASIWLGLKKTHTDITSQYHNDEWRAGIYEFIFALIKITYIISYTWSPAFNTECENLSAHGRLVM